MKNIQTYKEVDEKEGPLELRKKSCHECEWCGATTAFACPKLKGSRKGKHKGEECKMHFGTRELTEEIKKIKGEMLEDGWNAQRDLRLLKAQYEHLNARTYYLAKNGQGAWKMTWTTNSEIKEFEYQIIDKDVKPKQMPKKSDSPEEKVTKTLRDISGELNSLKHTCLHSYKFKRQGREKCDICVKAGMRTKRKRIQKGAIFASQRQK